MIDPLEWLWPLADATVPTVAVQHTDSWPDSVLERLRATGLLIDDELASRVLCPECQDHYEEVLACEGPGRETYSFIMCPALHRLRVPRSVRRQWSVNFPVLAQLLATTMTLTGKIAELSPRRVWRLGRTKWQDAARDVLLARGLHWSDAATVRGSITQTRKPIVFVPHAKPSGDYWSGRVPPIIALDQVALLGDAGIEIDPLEIAASIQDADARQNGIGVIEMSPDQLTLMIRRQIKAEHKSELPDDIFLAAYRQHGSVRKAAEYLTRETGSTVTKDQVFQAVKRAGGIAEVTNAEDSDSVVRTVASRSRDKRGKTLIQSQADMEE